ncbi:unnamed protein product [Ectocarpus sp. CCAP 1310/34]|nr:unnamed protein product [Ectocarpus sp. CCAP 1310/34]
MSAAAAALVPPPSSTPQPLYAPRPKIGDCFSSSVELRVASERAMLRDNRTMIADARGGGGHAKLYRCSGAIIEKGSKTTGGCQAHVKANKRADKHFYVTSVCYDHQNCAGGTKKPSVRAMAAEGAVVVRGNPKVSAPALAKTLKGAHGVDMATWAAGRVKRGVTNGQEDTKKEGIQRLASFLDLIATDSPGTITDCKVGVGV